MTPLPSRDRAIRATFVAAIFAILFGGVMGFAVAANEADGDLPGFFGVPLPNVGDQGRYELYRFKDGQFRFDRNNFVDFEWLPSRFILDYEGKPRWALVLKQTIADGPDDKSEFTTRNVTLYYEATSRHLLGIATEQIAEYGQDGSIYARGASGFNGWRMLSHLTASQQSPYDSFSHGVCGLLNPLQGVQAAVIPSLNPFGDSWCNYHPTGQLELQWHTHEKMAPQATPADRSGLVFTVSDHLGPVHVWFEPTSAYPTQVLTADKETENPKLLSRLVMLKRGPTPITSSVPPSPSMASDLRWSPRTFFGPDASGIQQEFSLQQAFGFARDDSRSDKVRQFVQRRPGAYIAAAASYERWDNDERTISWSFRITDGNEDLDIGVKRVQAPTRLGRVLGEPPKISYVYDNSSRFGPYISLPPEKVPLALPTLESLAEQWRARRALEGKSSDLNQWGFNLLCFQCDNTTEAEVSVGWSMGRTTTDPLWPGLGARESEFASDRMIQEVAGGVNEVRFIGTYATQPYAIPLRPLDEAPSNAPHHDLRTATAATWAMPTDQIGLGVGVAAALVGLLYYFLPALKQWLLAPLYSRLVVPRALHQGTRAQLYHFIKHNPGAHLQAVYRAAGPGHGNVEHHLRQLELAGLIVSERAPGFTCYFVKGETDRRLQAAAAVTKSDGAQRILAALAKTPNMTQLELSRALGLSPPTVLYHVRRLQSANLVQSRRWNGRTELRSRDPTKDPL